MNSTNYITPFWIQDLNQTSGTFTINIYRTQGYSSSYKLTIYYSTDGSTWSTFGTTRSGQTISQSFSAGTKVYLKCDSNYWSLFIGSDTIAHQITANKTHAVGGNVMSLIYGSTFAENRKYVTFPDDSVKGVFLRMFYNNTNLIDAGELVLPVTHSTSTLPTQQNNNVCLASCYSRMFYGCTNLVNGPHIDLRARGQYDLPYCFQQMFNYDTSLMSVHCNTQAGNFRYNAMFSNNAGASGSVFYDYSGGPTSSEIPTARMEYRRIVSMYLSGAHEYDRVVDWHSDYSGRVYQVTDNNNKVIYLNEDADPADYSEPFYVQNITNQNETLSIKKNDELAKTLSIQYSTNKTTWNSLGSTSVSGITRTITPGEKLYLRCKTNYWTFTNEYELRNVIRGVSKVGGNIMSLLYGSDFTGNEKTFPTADGTQFKNIFSYNINLIDAENLLLPATTLDSSCYGDMFHSCSLLTKPPVLKCMNLVMGCYSNMFYDCTSLVNAPQLPAYNIATGCYNEMFHGCTSLVNAPDLNAATLKTRCYKSMFTYCSNLRYVRCLATTAINTENLENWLYDVSSTGTFYKKAGTTWTTGASGIPSGWTVVEV